MCKNRTNEQKNRRICRFSNVFILVGAHETLMNNNQPHAKTLLKISVFARLLIVHLRIRHALRSGVSVRHGINKNTQMGVFVYSGWGARIRTMIKRTKISCPTIRRHPKNNADYNNLSPFCNYFLFYNEPYFWRFVICFINSALGFNIS